MLAHQQGGALNLSQLAGSLGIDGKTARRYLDLLEGLYLVRALPPWSHNAGKPMILRVQVGGRRFPSVRGLAGGTPGYPSSKVVAP